MFLPTQRHTQLDQLLQYKGNSSWQHCKQSRFKNNHPQRVDSTHREIAFLFTNRAIYCFHYHKRMNTRELTPFWHSEVKACPKRCLQAPPVVSHPVSHKDTLQYGQKVREAPEQAPRTRLTTKQHLRNWHQPIIVTGFRESCRIVLASQQHLWLSLQNTAQQTSPNVTLTDRQQRVATRTGVQWHDHQMLLMLLPTSREPSTVSTAR